MINFRGIAAIYKFEMARAFRTFAQTIASPIISTMLYFIVFGSAIGSRITDVEGIAYSAFIIPGLMMLTVLSQSVANASFGIYFPRYSGTIYEVLSAPLSFVEVAIGYVGGAATKALIIGVVVLITASFFVPLDVQHPFMMASFLLLTCISFSMLGFIIGIWADGFEKLQLIPLLVITPLTFLGGSFYSLEMLPEFWQKVSMLNPVVYLVSGFRWSFYEHSDVPIGLSLAMIGLFLLICTGIIAWIFKTGYRLKS